MAKAKTKSIPVGAGLGLGYGTVYQPLFGGGAFKGQPGGWEVGKSGGLLEGLKRAGHNLLGNYTGYSALDGRFHNDLRVLYNGPGALGLGIVFDKAAKVFKVQKLVNRVISRFKITKYRWGSIW